jgi:iron only hydrogenase large subunit-like protein/nitrogen-specific signal transduction histidine kinase
MKKISDKPLEKTENGHPKLITTIGDRCKVCYTCVRDCPAKAIRILNGQAEVIPERCVGCGNCVRVCGQNAKQYYNSIYEVERILRTDALKVAAIAPSFPAEFHGVTPEKLVGALRQRGFDLVCEVAFGADIVSLEYQALFERDAEPRIGSTCPGIVAFVEKYHPELVEKLAPVVSPMLATAKALRFMHRDEKLEIVFIGPCVAKKAEAMRYPNAIDAVLTFSELKTMLEDGDVDPKKAEPSDFDPPTPGLGALYALSGGILKSAGMEEDLLNTKIICADGKNNFVTALQEFEKGSFKPDLLELLCCYGCVDGAGMSVETSPFARRNAVSQYVKERIDKRKPDDTLYERIREKVDFATAFQDDDHRLPQPSEKEIEAILAKMGKFSVEEELNCEACGYKTCREHAVAIHKGLAENEMCLPYTIERLKKSLQDLKLSHDQLEQTKQALFNAEKLASMGQLSAGIAHEINNPLGVILLHANLLLDFVDKHSDDYEDVQLIVEQAERCRKIVSGLLDFARSNKVILQPVDIVEFINHYMKSIMKNDNVEIAVDTSKIDDPMVEIDKDQIAQVLTNLIVNACEAMQPDGGKITVALEDSDKYFKIIVADDGPGIPKEYRTKIFEPLFTTKQIGKGTGLGLAVTYGIVKMHRGQITVDSSAGNEPEPKGTKFTIAIPRKGENDNVA